LAKDAARALSATNFSTGKLFPMLSYCLYCVYAAWPIGCTLHHCADFTQRWREQKWQSALVVEKRRSCMKLVFPYVRLALMNAKEKDVLRNLTSRTNETRVKLT